jgi:dihydropteroate synthase
MAKIMAVINTTPDSFFDGGRYNSTDSALKRAETALSEGADILDIGGASSRPGAQDVPPEEEIRRVVPVIEAVRMNFPDAVVSVDTWRAAVAREAVQAGARILNDISAGSMDDELLPAAAELKVPYVLMHIQGTPATMQRNPHYDDVVTEVLDFFIRKVEYLHTLGIYDIILDPGFGFGKTVEHNFTLLKNMHVFGRVLQLPVLAGLSRKSMICRTLNIKPADALNGTTALNMVALQQGASFLRVHDVREAAEVIKLYKMLETR